VVSSRYSKNAICYLLSAIVTIVSIVSIVLWFYPVFTNFNGRLGVQPVFERSVGGNFKRNTVEEGDITNISDQYEVVREANLFSTAFPSIKRPDSISPVEWRSLERAAKAAGEGGERLLNRFVDRVSYNKQGEQSKMISEISDKELGPNATNGLVSNIP